ncbi:DNA polymerase III subunit chi [Sphingomonas turrisvirgatae]|uniref:DNA polymerase III subunit chi n=1 Tax=Sphingomonas turrisvirgatae TaxID=1888892 RepID=A0A1E3LTB1_9SPHN|nr:DNA polymerase III subunit chi [Sphingomonas turrisvirgatae]ODP36415.1 DNA polymerase III subunit chi [Sphingomonas turrisvirgatae]
MQVDFYHLTTTPVERALPSIAVKVVESGGRLLVVSGDEGQRRQIDASLWTWQADSFLPHAQAGAGDDSLQPVLIGEAVDPANGARFVALIDGVWRDEALAFDRAFHFFDGERIAESRAAWKALADRQGVERRYFKQDENGRWGQAA